jgi:serralysin
MALGSEIGNHSYTHPHDTNELSPAEIQFEFQQSKQVIESNLGIVVLGAAVPGAPEKLPTSREIIQYFDYLSGGYSSTGAGYPGAFGYLTPGDTGGVYLAPNMSFDFTLIGFQGLTPAEAEAVWAAEYAEITAHGKTPIIAFPWHDYGPTDWDLGDPNHATYTTEMFTNVIARAAADGTEFVTGADLAARIDSFAASDMVVTANGNTISANVTSPDAGKFALTLDDGVTIDHVANWYAWDGNKVFLPQNGGQFDITTGSAPDDVTRLAELPMRAELISANGDGKDLDFSLVGRGTATVDLKAQGTDAVVAVGADKATLQGERLELTFDDQGTHNVAIDYNANNQIAGSAADEGIFGGSDGESLDGGGGNDTLFGSGGADTFVYGLAGGNDTILDFTSGTDKVELVNLGFLDTAEAHAAFAETGDGLVLSLDAENNLLLADLQLAQFTVDDILLTDTVIS